MKVIKLPTKGTEAQIRWATDIVERFQEKYQNALSTLTDDELDRLGKKSASWWIDNRQKNGKVLVEFFVREREIRANRAKRWERAVERLSRE